MAVETYFNQLSRFANRASYDLKEAFQEAGINTSVYYRALNGGDLHIDTANKVMNSITTQLHK